jgi:hypothetical protein
MATLWWLNDSTHGDIVMQIEDGKQKRGKRVTIDLTPAASEEMEVIAKAAGLSVPELFRQSFGLFRLYVNAKKSGGFLAIVTGSPPTTRQLELALPNDIS